MKLKEITECIEAYAPLAYQESYDNAGLICGNKEMEITAALICLDSTEAVIDEAIQNKCNLVIAHHPIVFEGLKKITGNNYVERVLIKAIQNNIAIYAAHTNLDNVHNGVSAKMAEMLGLQNCKVLAPSPKAQLKKLVCYCPADVADKVLDALFKAGAGKIGNYDECSFSSAGTGTFRTGEGANPTLGEIGKRHLEKEMKLETIYPAYLENKLLQVLCEVHPYEEVAYDIINLGNRNMQIGAGMVGDLPAGMEEIAFLKTLKERLQTDCIRYTSLQNKNIKRVALCGGAGSFLLEDAIRTKADIFITGDFKYHQFFDADNQIVIADIGHYESEQFTKQIFYDILREKFNTFALHLSKINTNPIKYI